MLKFIFILFLYVGALFCQSKKESDFQITFSVKAFGLSISDTVFITGSLEKLGFWQADKIKMEKKDAETWIKKITIPKAEGFEYKYTLGSWQEEGADVKGLTLANFKIYVKTDTLIQDSIFFWTSRDVTYRESTITGTVKYHRHYKGDNDGVLPRDILVWLPPGYETENDRRYPVLYMHDGQNVFDEATSSFGNEWRADETCDSMINSGKIPPLIIIAVNNTGERGSEYVPGEKGQAYMDFIVNTLKPFIDSTYRTKPTAENTIVAGASSGGTISFMLVWEYPHIFSKAICMSPALKIDEFDYVKVVNASRQSKDVFFYIYNGGVALEAELQPGIDEMVTVLQKKGYKQGKDFELIIDPAEPHNEQAWARQLPQALETCLTIQK